MSDSIFEEGGSHKIKRIGKDKSNEPITFYGLRECKWAMETWRRHKPDKSDINPT